MTWTSDPVQRCGHGVAGPAPGLGHLRVDAAGDHVNYMDRQTLAQQATEISRDLALTNQDYGQLEFGFGMAFAVGG